MLGVRAAEAAGDSKGIMQFATMANRLALPDPCRVVRGISLMSLDYERESRPAVNLASTMSAELAASSAAYSFPPAFAVLRAGATATSLQLAATNQRGFHGSSQAYVQRVHKTVAQEDVAGTQTVSIAALGFGDGAQRPAGGDQALGLRGSVGIGHTATPHFVAASQYHRAAVFSASAVVEPLSQLMPIPLRSDLNFGSDQTQGSLQPNVVAPAVIGAGLIHFPR